MLFRSSDSMQLVFGRPQEFYEEVICRSWIFVESAPHKACDKWNEVPYFGTYSVVYDEHDSPMVNELGFVVRGVRLVEFARATSEDDIIQQIIMFWFTTVLIQDLVLSGRIDLTEIDRLKVPGELTRWWLGDEVADLADELADEADDDHDHALVDAHTTGFSTIGELCAPWTPERTAEVTGIAPATLREVVAAFRSAGAAAMYSSTGVNMGSNGVLGFWLQEVINAVSGNLDRPGGTVVGKGIFDFAKFGKRTGTLMSDDVSRIGGFRKTNDAFPGGILADEILTPGKGQIRALFVTGGNPLLTMANAGRLKEAFESLELLVTVDIYRNETGSLAHYTLPATDPLQRADLPFIFPLVLGMQSRPYMQATRAVVEPQDDQRDEASIYLALGKACGAPIFGSKPAQRFLERMAAKHARRSGLPRPTVPAEKVLNALLRVSRQSSFKKLLASPHGERRPELPAGSFLGQRVVTDDRRVHLAPERLTDRATRLEADFEAARARADRLLMISKRHVKTHNSWTHNHEEMVANDFTTNHLYLHPDDAARLGLADDDLADVASATATVRIPVRTIDDLMPGVCAMPHGWGHQHATGLSVASRTTGVNVNLLVADGPDAVDPASGMSHLTGIPVDVTPAAGPLDPTSWSGIAAGV